MLKKTDYRILLLAMLFLPAMVVAVSAYAADTPPPAAAVDEFGIPLSSDPPPVPPGYASQDETMKAMLAGKFAFILPTFPVPIPEGVVEKKDIEYGNIGGSRPLLLDLYMPDKLDKPAPGLIFIHGGGWEAGNRSDYKYYTVRYAKRGYVVATISYRFSQEAPFPAAVQDAKCAVRWMRANAETYHINPDKIAVIGGSAGGYLSMMIGYSSDVPELEGDGGHEGVSSRVQAVVDLYGPTDIECVEARDEGVVRKFIGKTYDEAPEQYKLATPITHLTKDDPPTLIIHGTIDDIVPIAQSDLLAGKLKALGIPCEYDKIEGWPHTLDAAVEINKRCQWLMNRFFDKYLRDSK